MRIRPLTRRAAVLLGTLIIPVASVAGSTYEDPAEAQKHKEEASVALDATHAALTDLQAELDKVKEKLRSAYRVLDGEIRRGDKEGEADSRATIEELKATRDRLSTQRDQAHLRAALHQAELESAQALIRISELESTTNADPAQVAQWQKKREKAEAKARRLERDLQQQPDPSED